MWILFAGPHASAAQSPPPTAIHIAVQSRAPGSAFAPAHGSAHGEVSELVETWSGSHSDEARDSEGLGEPIAATVDACAPVLRTLGFATVSFICLLAGAGIHRAGFCLSAPEASAGVTGAAGSPCAEGSAGGVDQSAVASAGTVLPGAALRTGSDAARSDTAATSAAAAVGSLEARDLDVADRSGVVYTAVDVLAHLDAPVAAILETERLAGHRVSHVPSRTRQLHTLMVRALIFSRLQDSYSSDQEEQLQSDSS